MHVNKNGSFNDLVKEAISTKEAFIKNIHQATGGDGVLISPVEFLSKVRHNPEFSDDISLQIESILKWLGISNKIRQGQLDLLEHAEDVPDSSFCQYEEVAVLEASIEHIETLIFWLAKWCSNLHFADRTAEQEDFFKRSMEAGEKLFAVKKEIERLLSL